VESALDPADKVSRDFLEEQDLHVRNISPKAARQIELVAIRRGPAVGAGTPAPVRVVVVAVEARRRPRAPTPMTAEFTVARKVAVSAAAGFVPAW
jgi:hypothetical protein